jgi:hypothetical protein
MKIYKTAALVYTKYLPGDEKPTTEGYTYIDTIEHEGKFWLVPGWIYNTNEGWKRPERIILLDSLPHIKIPPENPMSAEADFFLGYSIPITATYDDNLLPLPIEAVVINSPDIKETIPTGVH